MTTEPPRRQHHLVSNGYQKNFAADGAVSVVDVRSAELLHKRRSTKKNWSVQDFLSVPVASERLDDALEKEIAKREVVVLNAVRDIRPFIKMSAVQRRSLDTLAALHLLRSEAFEEKRRAVTADWLDSDVPAFVNDPELLRRFVRTYQRPPREGELEALVSRAGQSIASDPGGLARSVRQGLTTLEALLAPHHVQLLGLSDSLPGFILADTPVLHGRRREGLFGFEKSGAVGDADTVVLPISRRVAASYAARPLRDVEIRTKNGLDRINALLAHGARREVLCHPDDALATVRLMRNLSRFPPSSFDRTTIH